MALFAITPKLDYVSFKSVRDIREAKLQTLMTEFVGYVEVLLEIFMLCLVQFLRTFLEGVRSKFEMRSIQPRGKIGT